MNNEDLFAAVMSGDFSKVDIPMEDLARLLIRQNYIVYGDAVYYDIAPIPEGVVPLAFRTICEFTWDYRYEVGDTIIFNFEDGWNNLLVQEVCDQWEDRVFNDELEDMYNMAIEDSIEEERDERNMMRKWGL